MELGKWIENPYRHGCINRLPPGVIVGKTSINGVIITLLRAHLVAIERMSV